MSERFELITAEDLTFIRTRGAPVELREDLVQVTERGLVFTVKGIQFYKKSCSHYGVEFDGTKLCSEKDLLRLTRQILERRYRQTSSALASAVENGELPPQQREFAKALLSGKADAALTAHQRRVQFESAGPNVIGIGSSK